MSHRREPIKHTCPEIDSKIADINILRRQTLGGLHRTEDLDELKDAISKCEDLFGELEDFLDNRMRKANDKLREWGCEEADKVDELESEAKDKQTEHDEAIAEKDSRIDDLESQVEDLEKEKAMLDDYVRCA